jgi:hypothetical protein
LVVEAGRAAQHVHADQSGDAAVHGVDRDRRRPQPVALGEPGEVTVGVEAPQQQPVRCGLVGQQPTGLGVELVDQLDGALGVRIEGRGLERRPAGRLGIRVGDALVEPLAPQDDEHAVLALMAEEHLGAVETDVLLEPGDQRGGFVVGDTSGAAIGDGAVGRERAQVAAGGDIAGAQLEVEAGGAQGPPAELEVLGVVAEQPQVARPRAGRDPRADRLDQPGDAFGRQPVEVRRRRLLELGGVLAIGVPAKAVHDDQQDLRVRRLDEGGQVHVRHGTVRGTAQR